MIGSTDDDRPAEILSGFVKVRFREGFDPLDAYRIISDVIGRKIDVEIIEFMVLEVEPGTEDRVIDVLKTHSEVVYADRCEIPRPSES